MENQQVRIHCDQHSFESPTPTTGADIYELIGAQDSRGLYREVTGDAEDELIRIDAQHVHLVQDEHFHTGDLPDHYYVIRVNTEPFVVDHEKVRFDEIVKLAYPTPPGGLDPEFTISFEHAESKPHHGDLAKGGIVEVKKHGTIFDVGHTNRS